ncbi:exonuclease domain-containing protein [Bifidobacterium felsineum]|uniref:exonuclease domain-containing protein n=1 Tax=Bifidobacterium felsineum TaxID=2045440 RepID=UPI001BDC424E|nr:exonuclease domain-containing protein [Bifidobacterium felsineum]MBT1164831.1 DNA polymerase III [Bifidobacterium felsineum]
MKNNDTIVKTDDQPTRLLWVDVETTGLDPMRDDLLEIGLLCTTPDLEPMDDGYHSVIRHVGPVDGFIQRMHGPNGLLGECRAKDARDGFTVMLEARDYIQTQLDAEYRLIPAGSSVNFDRRFLDANMPGLLDGCSHRSFDVSVLYEAIRMWNPEKLPDTVKTTDHRVMHCLKDSLAYAQAYRRLLCSMR